MSKFAKNLSWIFAGNIVHAILQFLLNILIARVLTTADYGLINYSASLIAFFTSLGTLGFNGIITKKISDEEDKAEEYLGSAIIYRLIFSIFAIISLQIIVRIFDPSNTKLHTVVFFQSITIFLERLI